MYIFKNAWKNITRSKGRNILIGIIILILLAGGLAKLLMSAGGCLIELLIVSIKAIIVLAFIIAFLSLLF